MRVGESPTSRAIAVGDAFRMELICWLQVYAILDEVFLAGEIEETSKQVVLTRLEHLDKLE